MSVCVSVCVSIEWMGRLSACDAVLCMSVCTSVCVSVCVYRVDGSAVCL